MYPYDKKSIWGHILDFTRGVKEPILWRPKTYGFFTQMMQLDRPVRYLITEKLEDFGYFVSNIFGRFGSFTWKMSNRFIIKTNCLKARKEHIKPGKDNSYGDRLIYSIFDSFQDYIEYEFAQCYVMNDRAEHAEPVTPDIKVPFWARNPFNIRVWKHPEAAVRHLTAFSEEIKDEKSGFRPGHTEYGKPTDDAIHFKEVLEIYLWWTVTRPNRIDYDKLYDQLDDEYDKTKSEKRKKELTVEMTVLSNQMILKNVEYNDEDTEMVNRLFKIRGKLYA